MLSEKIWVNSQLRYFLKTPSKNADSSKNKVLTYYQNLGFQKQTPVPQSIVVFCSVEKGQSVDFRYKGDEANNGILMRLVREPWRKNFQHINEKQGAG